jgi:hypothetical protein
MKRCALCWDNISESEALTGTAWGITGTICKECVEYVGNEGFKESLTPTSPTYTHSSVQDWDWSYYQDVWESPYTQGGIKGGITPYIPCHHHMVPFTFQGLDDTYTVYLSGSMHLSQTPTSEKLTSVGMYLDDGWLHGRLATNTAHAVDLSQPTAMYVGWPDFGVIEPKLLAEAIEWVLPYVYDQESTVEIACLGGHGRTGAFVAALLVREGWQPTDAVEYIRGGYCTKAIENKPQEELLNTYQNLLLGVHDESHSQKLYQA